jgi:hypothetical protein
MDSHDAQDEVFRSFTTKRESINRSLDEAKQKIDSWLANQPFPPPLNALANLEVLLKERRDSVAELLALDEEFMKHLGGHLVAEGEAGVPDPGSADIV